MNLEEYVEFCKTRKDSLGNQDKNCANCDHHGWFTEFGTHKKHFLCRKDRVMHDPSSPGNCCSEWKPEGEDRISETWHDKGFCPNLDSEGRVKLVIIQQAGEVWQIERSVFSLAGDWEWEIFVEENRVLYWAYAETLFNVAKQESEVGK